MDETTDNRMNGQASPRQRAGGLARISRDVLRIARRMRGMRVAGASSSVLSLALFLVACCATLDALVRFPWPLRVVMLGVVVGAVAMKVRSRLLPALRFRPTPVEVALRIERMRPELSGRLASAVEFDLSGMAERSALAARSLADAGERASGADLARVVRYGPTARRVGVLFLLVAGAVSFSVYRPDEASIALRRIVTPWSDVSWPARTAIASLVEDGSVAARGRPFALRARLERGDAATERVKASYRSLRGASDATTGAGDPSPDARMEASAWTDVVLSLQPGGDFERLIDAAGDSIEIRFSTSDAVTETVRVRLVDPPAVAAATLLAEPPPYARSMVAERREQLGDGTDARSVVQDPILEGSDVRVDVRLNRAVPFGGGRSSMRVIGTRDGATGAGSDGIAEASGKSEGAVAAESAERRGHAGGFSIEVDPTDATLLTIRGRADHATRIELDLVDENGIAQEDEVAFAFEVIPDREPTAVMVEPLQDESVLPDARVTVRAESRDDLALRSAGIEIATRIGQGAAESLALEERAAEFADGPRSRDQAFVKAAETERTLDLARLSVKAGDAVVLRAFAEDFLDRAAREANASHGGEEAAAAEAQPPDGRRIRSAARVLRIVGDDEFERQIRSTLAGVRRDAMRIDERQARARDQLERTGAEPATRDVQGSVTEGISRTAESVRETMQRLERNGRDEGGLGELAEQARDLLDEAEARSSEASTKLEKSADAAAAGDQAARDRSAAEAAEAQESVRAELEDLVSLLDRDEDAWVARKRLDELAGKVKQLTRETEQAAARSGGESREELSAESRAELDALAERQQQASSESEQVAQELRERAKTLAEADPQQSKALEEAAKAIEEGRVREELSEASESAQQNRLEQSKQSQQRASQALSRASEALSQDRKVKAEELARELESLVESIQRLLTEAEAFAVELREVPLDADQAADAVRDGLARSVGMLSQNTRGTAADARATSREAARVARFLDDAAAALAAVSGELRAEPFDADDAGSSMDAALKALQDALAAAEEAQERAEERAEEEKREELVAKYRDFLEREAAIRGSVEKIAPVDGAALGRREVVESRRLGTVQEELRTAIDALRKEDSDVGDSDALIEMHDVVDAALVEARSGLSGGKPGDAMPRIDEALESLAWIVSALEDAAPADGDRFEEGQDQGGGAAGGGGGGAQGAIPPVAEIKILRSMQESLMKRTRRFSESAATLDPVTRAQQLAEIVARQQRIVELGTRIAEKLGTSTSGEAPSPSVQPADVGGAEKDGGRDGGAEDPGTGVVPQHDSRPDSAPGSESGRRRDRP